MAGAAEPYHGDNAPDGFFLASVLQGASFQNMNTEHLKAIVRGLLADEEKYEIQKTLTLLEQHFQNLIAEPGQPAHQKGIDSTLAKLEASLRSASSWYTPMLKGTLTTLGLLPYFSLVIHRDIKRTLADNPLVPGKTREAIVDWIRRRQAALTTLETLDSALGELGFEEDVLESGAAEIGFTLPRDLFENDLDGLISELRTLRRIIRAFSELASGSPEAVEIRQINTSAPTFFFSFSVGTMIALGAAIAWALGVWKKLEEIRKIRAETKKLDILNTEELDKLFNDKISRLVEEAVGEHVNDITADIPERSGRKREQQTDLTWALGALFARIERGMTVEIKLLSPKSDEYQEDDNDPQAGEKKSELLKLDEVADALSFPAPTDTPVLSLPKHVDSGESAA